MEIKRTKRLRAEERHREKEKVRERKSEREGERDLKQNQSKHTGMIGPARWDTGIWIDVKTNVSSVLE